MEKSLDHLKTLLSDGVAKLVIGVFALLALWVLFSITLTPAQISDTRITPGIRLLIGWISPVGTTFIILILAMITGEILFMATRRILFLIAIRRLRQSVEPKGFSSASGGLFRPLSAGAHRRFTHYLGRQEDYSDILPENREEAASRILVSILSSAERLGGQPEALGRYRAELRDSVFRLSIAPWIALAFLALLVSIKTVPLVMTGMLLVGVCVLIGLVITGWSGWRDAQSLLLHSISDAKVDISDLVREQALRPSTRNDIGP